jgi:hypothetical protein
MLEFSEYIKKEKLPSFMDEILSPKSIVVISASSDSEKERKSGWLGRPLACHPYAH